MVGVGIGTRTQLEPGRAVQVVVVAREDAPPEEPARQRLTLLLQVRVVATPFALCLFKPFIL